MESNEIQVTLETPPTHIYRPGDIVIGNVTTNLAPNVDLSAGITITLYGHGYVHWNEFQGSGISSRSKAIMAIDQFFKLPQVYNASIHKTVYPFALRIPDSKKSLPWTIKTLHGLVEYGVEARVKRNLLHFDISNKATFTLNSYVDSYTLSSANPHLSNVLTSNCHETNVGWYCFPLCCWYYCCTKEKVTLTLSHQSILAMPGDNVPYTLDVDNSLSRRHLGNARIRLKAVWTHIAEDSTTRVCSEILQEDIMQLGVFPREQVTISGIFKLPNDIMPTQVECKVLKLTYTVQVYINEMTGFRCVPKPATVQTDILIGNA